MARCIIIFFLSILLICSGTYAQSVHSENVISPRDAAVSLSKFCSGFRFNAEVKNLVNGWLVPKECVQYIKRYILKGQYTADFLSVTNEARNYVKNITTANKLKTWIFDIDETTLSNIPYYAAHSFGALKFNATEFNAWVNKGKAAGLPTLILFNELIKKHWNVIFITGRPESQRQVTMENLVTAGFKGWTKLILRSANESLTTGIAYKSLVRSRLVAEGYEIWGNVGDQWSDISGDAAGKRVFKLPNPLYYIP